VEQLTFQREQFSRTRKSGCKYTHSSESGLYLENNCRRRCLLSSNKNKSVAVKFGSGFEIKASILHLDYRGQAQFIFATNIDLIAFKLPEGSVVRENVRFFIQAGDEINNLFTTVLTYNVTRFGIGNFWNGYRCLSVADWRS